MCLFSIIVLPICQYNLINSLLADSTAFICAWAICFLSSDSVWAYSFVIIVVFGAIVSVCFLIIYLPCCSKDFLPINYLLQKPVHYVRINIPKLLMVEHFWQCTNNFKAKPFIQFNGPSVGCNNKIKLHSLKTKPLCFIE